MSEVLALKYRPKSFSDVVGQKIPALVLDRMVQKDELPQGILLVGPRGCGKTTLARIIADSVGDENPIEVDAASHGMVADVRSMIETLRFSTGGKYRVVIYDEAHSMSAEAFNALLKTLEEPPAGTVFILVTTDPLKIPKTVKSRLMEFSLRKLTRAEIFDRLSYVQSVEGIYADIELLHYLADQADGSLRDALMSLDQCWKASISDLPTYKELSGEEDVAPDLVLAMLTGDHSYIFEIADDLSQRVSDPMKLTSLVIQTLRDVLVLKAGVDLSVSQEGLEKRKKIALNLEPERIVAGMRMLWDLRTRVRQASDPRGNMDLALVLITDIFTQGRKPAPKTERLVYAPPGERVYTRDVPVTDRRLKLAEL